MSKASNNRKTNTDPLKSKNVQLQGTRKRTNSRKASDAHSGGKD